MIIKSLLFIIVCIFVYETYVTLSRMTEEYFVGLGMEKLEKEKFFDLPADVSTVTSNKGIPIQFTKWSYNPNQSGETITDQPASLDTPYYARYKPLEYNPNREYYWNPHKLIEEGRRRAKDDEAEIKKVQGAYDKETDPTKKQILQDELNLFKWRKNILATKDKDTKLERDMRDITTDYYPEEIGAIRPWLEVHSHIPDYSY